MQDIFRSSVPFLFTDSMDYQNIIHEVGVMLKNRTEGIIELGCPNDFAELFPVIPPDDRCFAWLDAKKKRVSLITDRPRITALHLRTALESAIFKPVSSEEAPMATELELITKHPVGWQAQNPFGQNRPRTRHPFLRILLWVQVLQHPPVHNTVPPQRPATDEEIASLRPLRNLPWIHQNDAVVLYLGMTVGDVLRVDRFDRSVYWRLVVP